MRTFVPVLLRRCTRLHLRRLCVMCVCARMYEATVRCLVDCIFIRCKFKKLSQAILQRSGYSFIWQDSWLMRLAIIE